MLRRLSPFVFGFHVLVASDYHQATDAPTLIDAENGIECIDDTRTCIASRNVKVTKGPITLFCDTLTAKLRKGATGQNEIYFLHAQGNVKFRGLAGDEAISAEATYDIDKRELLLLKKPSSSQDCLVFRDASVLKASSFRISFNGHNKVDKVVAFGQSNLDIQPRKVIETKGVAPQTRALIYPDPLRNVKQSDSAKKTRSGA